MVITPSYRELQRQSHENKPTYGVSGEKYAALIRELIRKDSVGTVLDYGCGKRTLERALGFAIANYDPAIPGLDAPPMPADLVVCTDVLEHIEPDCLEAVLDDLKRVTARLIFLDVSTQPAMKHLPDGRNMHLIIEPARWWLPKLMDRFDLRNFTARDGEFVCVMERRELQ